MKQRRHIATILIACGVARMALASTGEAMAPLRGLTQGEIFESIALGVTALMAALLGGYAGWVNTKPGYIRAVWILLLVPLVMYIGASLVSIFIFMPDHKPESSAAGSIVFWYLIALPLVGVSAAFGWALVWLGCYFHKIVRNRK